MLIISFHFILIKPLQERNYFAHFIDDEIGFHIGKVTCMNTHTHLKRSSGASYWDLNPGLSKLQRQTIIVSPSVNTLYIKCI